MVSIEKAVIARIHREGKDFEILVDPDLALDFRRGKPVSVENVLAVRDIFSDSKKGDRPSGEDLQKAFQTTDPLKIAEIILKSGDIQLTTEQRRKLLDEKRKQIATTISKQGIDPKTRLPHPQQRILNAMEQAKISIDPFKPSDQQIEAVLKAIESVLPISIERVEIAIKIPMEHAGKASSVIRTIAPIKKEEWKGDGWYALIEIPAGMKGETLAKISDITHGQAEVKEVKK
ncbi:MAG: ribosome assembly factor SBDS [Candidatus Aenigmarchaeota archaeon]|nr:ribosome assembly factor SBDS [Candidatus Aenigmarchaeota archaeon]